MTRVLYISYDGLLDPLGRSQVQPYLRGLGRAGVWIRVISFEKPERFVPEEVEKIRRELGSCGVSWIPLRYHKSPAAPATAWDILRGSAVGLWIVWKNGVKIIHARSYVAALIARIICSMSRARLLFDMRGFWADEKVEAGDWPAGGAMYRLFKRLERILVARADSLVLLSERGVEALSAMLPAESAGKPLMVIPTCADLKLFRPGSHRAVGGPGDRGLRLVYVGSLGSWYLPVEMLRFFGVVLEHHPESIFRIVSPSPRASLDTALVQAGLRDAAAKRVSIGALPYDRVAETLRWADFSMFFIRPSFSKQASCATKFAESLACGTPVLLNSGIGDHAIHVMANRVGVVLEDFSVESFSAGLDRMERMLEDPGHSSRCRGLAEREFSLTGAVDRYLALYGATLNKNRGR